MMEDHLQDYLYMLQVERNLSPNSLEAYKRDLKRYIKYLKTEDLHCLEDISEKHIQGFIIFLNRTNKAATTISRYASAIRGYHLFLTMEGFLKENPSPITAAGSQSSQTVKHNIANIPAKKVGTAWPKRAKPLQK